jgi:acyl-CoA dehydrogenase
VEFEYSEKTRFLQKKLSGFMDEHIYPNEAAYYRQHAEGERWTTPPLLEELKAKAKAAGLWNLFLPESEHGAVSATSSTRRSAR